MTSGFLGKDDLRQLTGAARQGDQVAWLRNEGVPYLLNPRDDLLVTWFHVHGGRVTSPAAPAHIPSYSMDGLKKWQAERRAFRESCEQEHSALMEANRGLLAANRREVEREERERRRLYSTAYTAKRKAAELQRTPSWADFDAIAVFYAEARALTRATGIPHHVDHILPLQGRKVSGLHVQNNLQVLTRDENVKKNNSFEP